MSEHLGVARRGELEPIQNENREQRELGARVLSQVGFQDRQKKLLTLLLIKREKRVRNW